MNANSKNHNRWKIAFWIQFALFCCAILFALGSVCLNKVADIYAPDFSQPRGECIEAIIEYQPYLNRGLPVSDLADTLQAAFPDRTFHYTGDNGIIIGDCGLVFDAEGRLVHADYWPYSGLD